MGRVQDSGRSLQSGQVERAILNFEAKSFRKTAHSSTSKSDKFDRLYVKIQTHLDSVKRVGTMLRNRTSLTLQLGTIRAVVALIKFIMLLANKASRVVEEVAATVVSKEFVKKQLAMREPFLETTLKKMLESVPGKRNDVTTHGSIIVPRSLSRFGSLCRIRSNCGRVSLYRIRITTPSLDIGTRGWTLRRQSPLLLISILSTGTPSTILALGNSYYCRS